MDGMKKNDDSWTQIIGALMPVWGVMFLLGAIFPPLICVALPLLLLGLVRMFFNGTNDLD
jgi:hypothetical protein